MVSFNSKVTFSTRNSFLLLENRNLLKVNLLVHKTKKLLGLNIFISNQFIQYNTIFNHTNIRIRTEARAYQVLLLNNILTKCRWQ